MKIKVNWTDDRGEHRGLVIAGGQAHVGHLVGMILSCGGSTIRVDEDDSAAPPRKEQG